MKTRNLRKQARRSAKSRGHRLIKFTPLSGNGWSQSSMSSCEQCGDEVWVYPNPAPNGADVVGEAVATNCRQSS